MNDWLNSSDRYFLICNKMLCEILAYSTGQNKNLLIPSNFLFETEINSAQLFKKCKFNKE